MDYSQLRTQAQTYLPEEKLSLVDSAYEFAEEKHRDEKRQSGEPYIEHPLQTAMTLAELQIDAASLAAALLHDVTENCDVPINEIEKRFGSEVSKLVDGVTRLGKLVWGEGEAVWGETQARNMRKMLVAMAEDLRVVFIKLADRLHNMRTLSALPPEKQIRIAQETQEIYAPLAHRLGIWELKWQLEDLSFRYLNPDRYQEIVRLLASRRAQRERFVTRVMRILRHRLMNTGLKVEISGRPKHIFSIDHKMGRYEAQGKRFDDIHDLLAVRVTVETVQDCYAALGVIHSLWRPLPGEFDDYIANPKANGYRSLHTVVMFLGTTPLEIQIRTYDMQHVAEYGVAAHWRYKEGEQEDMRFEERIAWLRQLIEWHREFSGAEEFLESVKTDIFIDQVFVFTPRGEIKDLPMGATPLDFAYRVHTELGHRCIGAKVNGKLVPFSYQLKNGDIVEIMTSKTTKGPSRDWLSPHLGYVQTSHAKEKIRQWFKKQQRAENIERGREILEKEIKRLGIRVSESRDELAKMFKYDSVDDFLFALGYGGVSLSQLATKMTVPEEQPKPAQETPTGKKLTSSIKVLGAGDMLTHLAPCCNPVPGDDIIGYITRSRGVTVHRKDCINILKEEEKERLVPVEWGTTTSQYQVSIQVEAWDRVGLVRDITAVVAEEKVNIQSVNFSNRANTTITILTIEARDVTQVWRVMGRIEGIRGVISVNRVGDEGKAKS